MESTPPVENSPPELPNPSIKRKTNEDDETTRGASKRQQTGKEIDTTTSASATKREIWNNNDLDLLFHIQDFHDKRGYYPFSDLSKYKDFYKNWILGNEVYGDFIEMNKRMDELNGIFLSNFDRKSRGEDVERFMDDIDKEIFRRSNVIWGKKDVNAVNNPSEARAGGVNPNEG